MDRHISGLPHKLPGKYWGQTDCDRLSSNTKGKSQFPPGYCIGETSEWVTHFIHEPRVCTLASGRCRGNLMTKTLIPKDITTNRLNVVAFEPPGLSCEQGQCAELLWPVQTRRTYLQMTAEVPRSDLLFVCHTECRQGHALSKQQLSKWIFETITHSCKNTDLSISPIKSHSTRVSVSWAAL